MKQLLSAAAIFVLSFFAARYASAQTTPDPVYARKTAESLGGDKYKITLESFVSGTNVASDIAIVMDLSASMDDSVTGSPAYYARERKLSEKNSVITTSVKDKTAESKEMTATKKALTATPHEMKTTSHARKTNHVSPVSRYNSWTYDMVNTYHYPFYLYNGQYYRVQRGNNLGPNGNIRALWIDTPDGTKYLTGTSLSDDDPGTVTTNGGTIYKGTLYEGYSWANVVAGTTAGETTMTYLYDDGEYYPVKRNRFRADGTLDNNGPLYALWIDTRRDGVRFLNGGGVRSTPDPAVTADNIQIYCGDLYDSGWTYDSINGPFYYEYGGIYYPVHQKMEDGTYSLYIDVNGSPLYLNGEGVSDHPVHSVKKSNQSIFFGSLYSSGGWYYDLITSEYSYLHEGNYYPVRRGRFNADGTPNTSGPIYAISIEMGGTRKFLSGNGLLLDKPYEKVTLTTHVIFSGTLYSNGWTYAGIKNKSYYYLHGGTLYPVHTGIDGEDTRFLYIVVDGSPKYLKGTGVSDTYEPSVKTDNQCIFWGALYDEGWYYNSFNNDETDYNYLLDGTYYPVRRGRFDADGTPNTAGDLYAIYIEVGGTRKFLSGNGLRDEPYEMVTSPSATASRSIFSGTLYKGGWTYTNITGDNIFFYRDPLNGAYYPVKRSNTLPDGNGNNNVRALWIETSEGKKYLVGDRLEDDYIPSFHSDAQGLFYGMLYKGGWSYSSLGAGNSNGNDSKQWYYLYNNQYYPVRRANNLGNGNVRALWIETPDGTKYLSVHGLSGNLDTSVTADEQVVYLGSLYQGWTSQDITSNYYYKQGDDYFPVSKETVDGKYQLSVTIGNDKYYLNGTSITATPNPYAGGSADISLYFNDLYYKRSHHIKVKYLIEAVEALIDALASDAKADGLHHRVALVEFSYAKWANNKTERDKPYLKASVLDAASSHVVTDFLDVTEDSHVETIKKAIIPPHSFNGGSYYDYGLSLAKALFERELGPSGGKDFDNNDNIEEFELPTLTGKEHEGYAGRPKVVILIGDCIATDYSSATTVATKLKEDVGAKVFVVHVNGDSTSATYAKKWASPNIPVITVSEFDSSLVTALEGLNDDIRKAAIDLDADTVVQDVIADGFVIPDESSDVKVYTAAYKDGKEKETMEFDNPVLVEDNSLVPVFSTDGEGHKVVGVSGFNYSENYCGTVSGEKRGKKVIIEIELERTTAVGGPATLTNTAESGMKYSDDGAFVTRFENPTLAIPVNITIRKEGLSKGESAVFTVQPVDADGEPVPGTVAKPIRLILTGDGSGNPVSRSLKNLDEHYHWLVTEDNWSWNYEVNGGNPSLSTMTTLVNPFIFTNVKQGTTIKSAESKVTNDFSVPSATTVNSREQ